MHLRLSFLCAPEQRAYIDDCRIPLLCLLLEVAQEVSAPQNIQVDSDLIKKQHLQRNNTGTSTWVECEAKLKGCFPKAGMESALMGCNEKFSCWGLGKCRIL